MEQKEKTLLWIVRIGLIILAALGVIFLLVSIFDTGILPIVLTVLFLVISLPALISGFKIIPNEKRLVIEVLGRYLGVYGPGFVWLTPFVLKVREEITLSEQKLRLWNPETDHQDTIDFMDGSAAPLGAFAFVQIIGAEEILNKQDEAKEITPDDIKKLNGNIFKFVYASEDAKRQAINQTENMGRAHLNGKKLDEGLLETGYDFFDSIKKAAGKDAELKARVGGAEASVTRLGIVLRRITIADFELSPSVIAARELVLRRQKEAEAAKHKAKTISTETIGAKLEMLSELTGKSVAEIRAEINGDPEKRKAFDGLSTELLEMRMGYDAHGKFEIGGPKGTGGGGLKQDILELIAALKMLPGMVATNTTEQKQDEAEKTGEVGDAKKEPEKKLTEDEKRTRKATEVVKSHYKKHKQSGG